MTSLETWKTESVPWYLLFEMSQLTNLIYDYAKYWTINNFLDLDNFFSTNTDNETLCMKDKECLQEMKGKYPQGEIVKFHSNDADLQCVVGKNPHKKRYTLIFRGSEGLWDWLYDLLIIKTRLEEDIYVHKGFYKQLMYNNTFDKIVETVNTCHFENPDWEWVISGHSLGAALSTLSGYLLAQRIPGARFTVVSLASPRVGDFNFKDAFNKIKNLRHFRITNHRDSVVSIPTWRYYHTGHAIHYNGSRECWEDFGLNPPSFYLYNCWNPFDHSCGHYVKHLSEKIKDTIDTLDKDLKERNNEDDKTDDTNTVIKEVASI